MDAPLDAALAMIDARLLALDAIEAEHKKGERFSDRMHEPLNRWQQATCAALADAGLPQAANSPTIRLVPQDEYVEERIATLRDFLDTLRRQVQDDPALLVAASPQKDGLHRAEVAPRDPRKVAVLYGRNTHARDGIFAMLRALKLDPIEWEHAAKATGKGSPYNKEVVDKIFEMAQAAVVLLTPDEEVRLDASLAENERDKASRQQARANVLVEAGMALATATDRTILVSFGEHALPSDLDGLNIIRFRDSPTTRNKLRTRLVTVGCHPEDAGDDWLRDGAEHFKQLEGLLAQDSPHTTTRNAEPSPRRETQEHRRVEEGSAERAAAWVAKFMPYSLSFDVGGEKVHVAWGGPVDEINDVRDPRLLDPAFVNALYGAICRDKREPLQPVIRYPGAGVQDARDVWETDEARTWRRKLQSDRQPDPRSHVRVLPRKEGCLRYCERCGGTGNGNFCGDCGGRDRTPVEMKSAR